MSNSKALTPLKIYFFSMDGAGHLNACVGMAQPLVKRGHVVKFLLNETFAGQFEKFGFEEITLKRKPKVAPQDGSSAPTVEKRNQKNPFKDIAEQLAKSGILDGKSPLERLKTSENKGPPGFMVEMTNTLADFDPQLVDILKRDKPDVIILDHFFVPAALPRSGIPWFYLSSGNPLNLYKSDKLPPFGSGMLNISFSNNQTLYNI